MKVAPRTPAAKQTDPGFPRPDHCLCCLKPHTAQHKGDRLCRRCKDRGESQDCTTHGAHTLRPWEVATPASQRGLL